MIDTIKSNFSGHVHQNIVHKIIEQLPEEEHEKFFTLAISCYKKYRDNKKIMKNHSIFMEDFFRKKDENNVLYSKSNFERFSDSVEKTIISHEAHLIEHRIKTTQTEHLFTDYTRQIIKELVVADFSKREIQEFIGKKINGIETITEFSEALNELFETKMQWNKDYYFELIKKNNLKENIDYIIHYEDDKHLNIEIITFKASQVLGVRMWCLVRNLSHFEDYRSSSKRYLIYSYDFSKEFSELNSILATLFDVNLNLIETYLKNDEIWDEYLIPEIKGFKEFEEDLQQKIFPDKANWENAFLRFLNDPFTSKGFSCYSEHNFNDNFYLSYIYNVFSFCLEPIPESVLKHCSVKYDNRVQKKEITIYDINKANDIDEYNGYDGFLLDNLNYTELYESNKIHLLNILKNDDFYNQKGLYIQMLNNAIKNNHFKLLNLILNDNFDKLYEDYQRGSRESLFKQSYEIMVNEKLEVFQPFMEKFLMLFHGGKKEDLLISSLEDIHDTKTIEEKENYYCFVKKELGYKIKPHNIQKPNALFQKFICSIDHFIDLFEMKSKDDLFYIYDVLFVHTLDQKTPKRNLKLIKNFSIVEYSKTHSLVCGSTGFGKSLNPYNNTSLMFGFDFINVLINGKFEMALSKIKNKVGEGLFLLSLKEYCKLEKTILFNIFKISLKILEDEKRNTIIKKGFGFYEYLSISTDEKLLADAILGIKKDRENTNKNSRAYLIGDSGFSVGEMKYEDVALQIINKETIKFNL